MRGRATEYGEALTPREKQVLMTICAGETATATAKALGIKTNTVKSHLVKISIKLGSKTTGHSLTIAYQKGEVVIPLDDAPGQGLKPSYRKILQGLARGESQAEIAEAVHANPNTLKSKITIMYRQLGAKDRTNAVYRGFQTRNLQLGPTAQAAMEAEHARARAIANGICPTCGQANPNPGAGTP